MEVLDSWKLEAYLNSAWVDITSYVASDPMTNRWGMSSNDEGDRLAKSGKLSFSLNNSGKEFTPGSATMLTGWRIGAWLKWTLTYATVDYVKFYGFIDTLSIDPGAYSEKKVRVTAMRWMDYAAQYPLKSPAIQQNVTADEALTSIVGDMPIQPLATSYDEGNSIFPIIFDNSTTRTIAYTEFSKLANSEPGYIYEHGDGTLIFENSTARGTDRTLKQVDGNDVVIDNTMSEADITYGDKIINRFTATARPKAIDAEVKKIYELESPLFFEAGQTKTFEIQYTDPTSKRLMSALTPPSQGGTKSLLHMDGVPFSEYIDEMGNTWIENGVSKLTSDKKFGSASAYFDGSHWMYTADKDDWDLGTSDFFISMWAKILDETAGLCLFSRDYNLAYSPFLFGYSDGANLDVYITSNGSSWDIANAKTFGAIDYDWQHLALGRSGENFYTFLNGALVDTWTSSAAINSSTQVLSLGRSYGAYAIALIDEFQFVKGVCPYTATFTPPAAAGEAEGQYWAAWTNADKTGTELTGQFTVTGNFGGAGAVMTVTNTSASDGYLTTLKMFSHGVHNDSPITFIAEDTASYEAYGYQNNNLEMPYQSDIDAGIAVAQQVVSIEKQPRLSLNKIRMNANRSAEMMGYLLNCDIGDMVQVVESQTGFEGNVYIQGCSFTLHDKQIIDYEWITKQDFTANISQFDLSLIGCEFSGGGSGGTKDAIDFGNVSAISNIYNRAFSAWIYVYRDTSEDVSFVFSTLSETTGVGIYLYSANYTNGYIKLALRAMGFSVGFGDWTFQTGFPMGEWVHIFAAYDNSSASNDPTVYINGESITIDSGTTESPSGTIVPETSNSLVLGNSKDTWNLIAADYEGAFNGQIADFRIYDMDVCEDNAATLAAALTAAGKEAAGNTSGLVFQTFGVPTASLASYEGLTLTTQVLHDTIGYKLGAPHGSPVTRSTIPTASGTVTVSSDACIVSGNPTTNTESSNLFGIGNTSGADGTGRAIVKFDFSAMPAGAIITEAALTITIVGVVHSTARTLNAYRILRAVNMTQATWNEYSTGNNWGTAGCGNSTTDYDGAVVFGTASVPFGPDPGDTITIDLDPDEMTKFLDGTYDNYGLIMFYDTENLDLLNYASIEHATTAYRPTLSITYHL